MAGIDFGRDLATTFAGGEFDLNPAGTLDTPERSLAMGVARRFVVGRGELFYDADYGLDLRAYLAKAMTTGERFRLRARAAAEAEKDERVESASADVAVDAATSALTVRIECEAALGPFSLTLAVSSLTVALLAIETE